jgi:hypothetical protein
MALCIEPEHPRKEAAMYALVLDERDPKKPLKEVISLHRTRQNAQKALDKRMKKLGKRVWECDTRIVWIDKKVKVGSFLNPRDFSTWRPGEEIPEGELHADTD